MHPPLRYALNTGRIPNSPTCKLSIIQRIAQLCRGELRFEDLKMGIAAAELARIDTATLVTRSQMQGQARDAGVSIDTLEDMLQVVRDAALGITEEAARAEPDPGSGL